MELCILGAEIPALLQCDPRLFY